MKLKSLFNQLYASMFAIAVILSALISFMLYRNATPWEMELIKTEGPGYRLPYEFRDFNHDGFSEQVQISNDPDRDMYYMVFLTYNGAIIDQLNIREQIIDSQVFYGDYTGDGYDECFVFTSKQDSVFLYAFNIIKHEPILNRQFLIHIPKQHPFSRITNARLTDLEQDSQKKLLFTLHPGMSPTPRGLYVYDLKKKAIIKRFENNASKEAFMLYDLDGNGLDEIILLGKANGNGNKHTQINDFKNWIFILNPQLNLIYPPLPFGSYPSVIKMTPIQLHGERFMLLAHYRAGQQFQKEPLGLYLINSKGRFSRQQFFDQRPMSGIDVIVDNPANPRYIFISTATNQLLRFDTEFNLSKQITTRFSRLCIKDFHDIDMDGKEELITNTTNGTQIFDQELNLLAQTNAFGHISFKQKGNTFPPEIAISEKEFSQFRLIKNPVIQWLPLLFILLVLVLFILLLVSNHIVTLIYTYFSYFMYSLKKTSNSVILLRSNGDISYYNNKVQTLFNSTQKAVKGIHYSLFFSAFPDILNTVDQCVSTKNFVQKDLILRLGKNDFKGQLSVVPFKTNFNYVVAYLIEIKDLTETIFTDRQKVWSRTIQKLAHDIKTPIAAVQLNLETVQMKIAGLNSAVAAETENDFAAVLTELVRVRELTRQFLKFSNLEKPNFHQIKLTKIINEVRSHFMSYFTDQLLLDVYIQPEADSFLADGKQMEILFQIFIENAIDALKDTGKIAITAIAEQNLEQPDTQLLVIEIADSGPGILTENQDHIFEPYYTTKSEGTGMGLTIAQKIVWDHSGSIELISRNGFGTVFRIILPKRSIDN